MTIKVTILGTSNSIIKNGYVDGLSSCQEIEIKQNLSVGSSQSAIVPFRLNEYSIANSDVIILDICVNEQRALQKCGYNETYSNEIFQYLLSECAKYDTIPFVLLMPEMNNDDSNAKNLRHKMRNFYINICNEYKIPYFDGYSYIEKSSAVNNTNIEAYFEDKNHVRSDQATNIGDVLAKILIDNYSKWKINKYKKNIHPFEYKKIESTNKIQRKTNITQVDMGIISGDDKAIVKSTPFSDVVGIIFNMSQSNASIKIVGVNSLVKILANSYTQPERSL